MDSTVATAPTSPSATSQVVVLVPCAACKILRRRCAEKCILAPYFPPTEPYKFAMAHRVFGAANIVKFLQEIPESLRADAVNSMVYEANARLRDPIYGCAGAISRLQDQMTELQAQLAVAQAEIFSVQSQNANFFSKLCMGSDRPTQGLGQEQVGKEEEEEEEGRLATFLPHHRQQLMAELEVEEDTTDLFLDENFLSSEWGPF